MAEILTESFCERCGTRYTFESAAPKAKLKGLKVMSRGFRNFVLSDDTSMDEAMAAARNETDREQTSQQLDAFHKTFNFCMSCRQYTCGNCWNEAEGRCLSCAPNLGFEAMPAPFANAAAAGMIGLEDAGPATVQDRNVYDLASAPVEPLAWPTSDLMREAETAAPPEPTPDVAFESGSPDGAFDAAIAAAAAEPRYADELPRADDVPQVADVEQLDDETLPEDESFDFAARFAAVTATAAVVTDEEPVAAPEAAVPEAAVPEVAVPVAEEPAVAAAEVAATDVAAAGPADVSDEGIDHPAAAAAAAAAAATAAANTSELFQRFRPGQSLDDEIEAYEREQAADAAAKAAAAAAALPEREPVAAEPAAPIAATAAPEPVYPEPEPVYPEPEPAPVETFEPEPVETAEPEPAPTWPEPAPAWPEPVAAEAAEPEPAVPAGDPRVDYVPQPTWQIVAPEAPATNGVPTPPYQQPTQPPTDAVAASGEPQWPDRDAAAGLPFLGRPAAATGGIDALWAASAQEVSSVSQVPQVGAAAVKPGGVQPCVSCGLSLSANARFCRRCGTRQG
ncbi:MAG TPA: hypothetical protein VFN41_00530 [Candidatus Limnocylindrales bacterium]|nr:hypothetical protein [Candidatus Limnocylindrales bacterium]